MAYVENVVMPLLNFEDHAEFAIDIWDAEDRLWVTDPRRLSGKVARLKELIVGGALT
jgi:hypothetical protein